MWKLIFINGSEYSLSDEKFGIFWEDYELFSTKKEAQEVGERYKEYLPRFKNEVRVVKVTKKA